MKANFLLKSISILCIAFFFHCASDQWKLKASAKQGETAGTKKSIPIVPLFGSATASEEISVTELSKMVLSQKLPETTGDKVVVDATGWLGDLIVLELYFANVFITAKYDQSLFGTVRKIKLGARDRSRFALALLKLKADKIGYNAFRSGLLKYDDYRVARVYPNVAGARKVNSVIGRVFFAMPTYGISEIAFYSFRKDLVTQDSKYVDRLMNVFDPEEFQSVLDDADLEIADLDLSDEEVGELRENGYLALNATEDTTPANQQAQPKKKK